MSLSAGRLLALAALLAGCHRGGAAQAHDAAAVATHRPFEVDFEGQLRGERGDGHRVVFVAKETCDAARLEETRTLAMALLGPHAKDDAFGAEASAHEGSQFYLCAFALDAADRMVAFGQYAHNPITVTRPTRAELELEDLDIVLSTVAPRAMPLGRYRGAR